MTKRVNKDLAAARNEGRLKYEGAPCKNCGTTTKYTKRRACVKCTINRSMNVYGTDKELKWREKRKLHDKRKKKFYQVAKKYGLTEQNYNDMLESQNGVCAICGTLPGDSAFGTLAVDHCHTTGKVRGLLCHNCNTGLGHFRESQHLLAKASAYLEITSDG